MRVLSLGIAAFFGSRFPRAGIVQRPGNCPFKRLSRRHDRHKDGRTSSLLCYRFWKCDPLSRGGRQGGNGMVRNSFHRRQIHQTGLEGSRLDQKRLLPAAPRHPRRQSGESDGCRRHDAQRRGEYAIHGTNNPGSVGGFVSHGCIRMHNADIMDLYARVSVGTTVVVLR